MKLQRKGEFLSTRVQYIPLGRIRPNPQQPRRSFDEEDLAELAASIRSCGILQPLTVRRAGEGYELVAGERRLRAARIAGLREVPCLVAQVGEEDSALLALMENLQRRDLDCWEEAQAIARLISRYGLSQEEAARRLGRAQPTVANKLRLLRLPEDVRALLRENGLTERHARALLRLQDPEVQRRAAGDMVRRGMNVAQAEAYVEKLLQSDQVGPEHLHHQGRAAVSQQRGPGAAPDAAGRGGRRMESPGYGPGDSADHPHPQARIGKNRQCVRKLLIVTGL